MSVAVVSDIVPLDKSVGLKVYNADVQELLEGHGKQLTTEELEHLQKEQEKMVMEEISDIEEGRENDPNSLIYEMSVSVKWGEVQVCRKTSPSEC